MSHRVSRVSGACRPLPLEVDSHFQSPYRPTPKNVRRSWELLFRRSLSAPRGGATPFNCQSLAQGGPPSRDLISESSHMSHKPKTRPPLSSAEVLEAIRILFETIQQPLPISLEPPKRQQLYRLQIFAHSWGGSQRRPGHGTPSLHKAWHAHKGYLPHPDKPSMATSHRAIPAVTFIAHTGLAPENLHTC